MGKDRALSPDRLLMLLLDLTVIWVYLPRQVESQFSTFLDYDLSIFSSALSHPLRLNTQRTTFTSLPALLNGLKNMASQWFKWNKPVQDPGEVRMTMIRLSKI